MKIGNLRICGRKNPCGVGWEAPLFSFTEEGKEAGEAVLIDVKTGKEEQKIQVKPTECGGFCFPDPLFPNRKYRFKVRTNGVCESATFSTAPLLDAKGITPCNGELSHPRFCKKLQLPKWVKSATLCVTGLGLYRAFWNGERVGERYLTPGLCDYNDRLPYQTYDLSDGIRAGEENRLEILLGDGWYRGRYGIDKPVERGGKVWGEEYFLCAKLYFSGENGEEMTVETGEDWEVTSSFCSFDSIYDGEIQDYANREKRTSACRISTKNYSLVPDDFPPLTVHETLHPTLILSARGEKILDFGQNFAGFVTFSGIFPHGSKIILSHGEILQDGCFYRENLRSAKAEAVYISDGTHRAYAPLFSYYGFRYVLVEGIGEVDPEDFLGVVLSQELEPAGSIECSHPLLSRLLENTLWGQKSNFIEIPTDCPQRDERLGWTADAWTFAPTACYRKKCQPFYRKYLSLLRYEQKKYYNGELPMYAPSLCGEAREGGAVWSDVATFLPWTIWNFYGSREVLAENFPLMEDYAKRLEKEFANSKTPLLTGKFTFGDWLAGDGMTENALQGGTPNDFLTNLYAVQSFKLTAKSARLLGREEEEARFFRLSEKVRKELQKEYFTWNGRLAVDSQTAYLASLAFDLSKDVNPLLAGLSERFKKDFYRLKTGFAGTPLALPTLFRFGMDREAYRILFREEYPSWFYEIKMGATTVWERWNSVLPNGKISGTGMNSLNHYAYGSVCEAVYGWIVGLRPLTPGFRGAIFDPHPGWQLKNCSFSFDTPAGEYLAKWEIGEKGNFEAELTVPRGAKAKVTLPNGEKPVMVQGGKHSFFCIPKRDFLHPFDENTPLLDLLSHPVAKEIVKKYLPVAYERMTGESKEFQVETLPFFARLPMFEVSEEQMKKCLFEIRNLRT